MHWEGPQRTRRKSTWTQGEQRETVKANVYVCDKVHLSTSAREKQVQKPDPAGSLSHMRKEVKATKEQEGFLFSYGWKPKRLVFSHLTARIAPVNYKYGRCLWIALLCQEDGQARSLVFFCSIHELIYGNRWSPVLPHPLRDNRPVFSRYFARRCLIWPSLVSLCPCRLARLMTLRVPA